MHENLYKANYLASQSQAFRDKFLNSLTDEELVALEYDWHFWARDKQKLPESDFFVWLILAGRGFGKTRTGAETVREWVRSNRYVNLIGATADDARDIMIEGESGIMSICPNNERPEYKKATRKLEWQNGAVSLIFTADEPERLRGKQHYKIWADEVASWRYPEAWAQAMMGLRLGTKPQAVVTTTPKPTKLILDLVEDDRNVVTVGTTYENKANLAKGFFDYVITKYEGTRLGLQELEAKILMDNPGALWRRELIDENRVSEYPDLARIVVGVDPTNTSDGDEAGIVTAGTIWENGVQRFYTLADDSRKGSPQEWAFAAISAYNRFKADVIVAEKNSGGDMVEAVIKQVDPKANVKLVWASRGKHTRAEPIATVAEQGRDHHVGFFPDLEDELCMWQPGDKSPNRLDAKVWAMTELVDDRRAKAIPSLVN